VVDLGAGTGKLTGSLLARGLRVTAVEPDSAMLAVLTRSHPAAEAVLAAAGDIPLPDGCVDAVVVGQAWHWFPHEQAAAEIRRVLRPGGWLGLAWNQVAPEQPWEVELEALNSRARGSALDGVREVPGVVEIDGLPSERLEAALFPWAERLTPAEVLGRMGTYSHIALLEPVEQQRLLDAMAGVLAQEVARGGGDTVGMSQQTYCVRWRP
jgi:SAM-dependent methyltransferase